MILAPPSCTLFPYTTLFRSVSLAARQPVLQRHLAAAGSGFGLAGKIPAGMRATAVRSNEIVGVAGFLFPGSHVDVIARSEEHTSELQSLTNLVCRLLFEKKKDCFIGNVDSNFVLEDRTVHSFNLNRSCPPVTLHSDHKRLHRRSAPRLVVAGLLVSLTAI